MSSSLRLWLLLAAAVGTMAASVFAVVEVQRGAAGLSFDRTVAVERMQEHQLDMETGLRGYLQFGRSDFLEPYRFGERAFDRALLAARQAAEADPALLRNLARQSELSRTWREAAQSATCGGDCGAPTQSLMNPPCSARPSWTASAPRTPRAGDWWQSTERPQPAAWASSRC